MGIYISGEWGGGRGYRLEIVGSVSCPERKSNRGRPPMITGSRRFRPRKKLTKIHPGKHTKMMMLAEAINVAVRFVMNNHIMYIFNGEPRKQ